MPDSDPTRRDFLKTTALAALSARLLRAEDVPGTSSSVVASGAAQAATAGDISAELHWLEDRARLGVRPVDVTWGVPWPRGAVARDAAFALEDGGGRAVPVQSWPLAFWPEGTLKWTAHAARAGVDFRYILRPGAAAAVPADTLHVTESADHIDVNTGVMTCRLPRRGTEIISEITRGKQVIAAHAALVCLVQPGPVGVAATAPVREFRGVVERATVEQSGPLRAVVKVDGRHQAAAGEANAWLPFSLRMYFHAGSEAVRVVYTYIFDGEAGRDAIAGLGFRFDVPLTDEWQNRHVRFVGDGDGMWGESVRNLPGWADPFRPKDLYRRQLAGERCPPLATLDAETREQIESVAAWNEFKLTQVAGTAFTVAKRTNPQSSWVPSGHGQRSGGTCYIGGSSGGVAFGLRDFAARHPSQLALTGALTDTAQAAIWFWSPDAPPMDLRHYDTTGHSLDVNYEDYEAGHSTPHGIASSHEFRLWALAATPPRAELLDLSRQVQTPPLLVCPPERYHRLQTFGIWSLPDRQNPVAAQLETQLGKTLDFYIQEIGRRGWDGYWDHGDIRHRYDADRHEWRYDVGGYAWDNNEMAPEQWLWYSFLRTGRADVFRVAEALSHHTRDVDMYHIGPFAPFGSRHNVKHWGCGAKEPRISMAGLKRPYYYMTADERTGDVMREVVDSDRRLLTIDPMRKVLPPSSYPTHVRSGPDWFAFASNWLAEWERTGDVQYRERIVTGLRDIAAMPHGMCSGPAFGYDPATHRLHYIGDDNYKFLMVAPFGGAEVVFELAGLIEVPEWTRAWLEFCEVYNAEPAEQVRRAGRALDAPFPVWNARLTAFAAHQKKDPLLAARAWRELLHGVHHDNIPRYPLPIHRVAGPDTLNAGDEIAQAETNHATQWSLNTIELLALVGEYVPAELGGAWA